VEYCSYTDSELGTIRIYMRRGVKQFTFRCKEGQLICTIPPMRKPESELKQVINQLRSELIELQKKQENLAAQHPALSPLEIEKLRTEAKKELPKLVSLLADKHGFTFQKIAIRNASSRWGSCSSLKHISLNLHLMRIPLHLREYVILHELCHTLEMNHGKGFWELLNRCTEGKALALRSELKSYHLMH